MEDHLNIMGYSDREEARILQVFSRGLLSEFPNPDRQGCPPSEVLRRIASHEMPLSEAETWLDHLGSCSPCYRDYLDLRAASRKRLQRTLFAVAAGVLLSLLVVGGIHFFKHQGLPPAQTAVLDLRYRSVTRGAERAPSEAPLEVSRRASQWDIQLPLGSPDGPYAVRLSTEQGGQVLATEGVATITGGITLLRVEARLSSVSPGRYVLQLREPTLAWNSYAVVVRR
jgi:hypothetical protein